MEYLSIRSEVDPKLRTTLSNERRSHLGKLQGGCIHHASTRTAAMTPERALWTSGVGDAHGFSIAHS